MPEVQVALCRTRRALVRKVHKHAADATTFAGGSSSSSSSSSLSTTSPSLTPPFAAGLGMTTRSTYPNLEHSSSISSTIPSYIADCGSTSSSVTAFSSSTTV
eukprot:CAMPEP_0206121748 /NCGR_PEP_ID=MMETSP1472-20131121/1641_1 /ASSEMBLY_ACC=CAM_ASM_001108 /TAXON_ID=41880 /ORGANISM="Pycnococcus provasolii, Strain RCC251" /LENGTH=101 /DNA_ID=CAMNT_0053512143 /DNA_START=71 /DNA_END=373 /DNA_ORIENTATION=-